MSWLDISAARPLYVLNKAEDKEDSPDITTGVIESDRSLFGNRPPICPRQMTGIGGQFNRWMQQIGQIVRLKVLGQSLVIVGRYSRNIQVRVISTTS